MAKHLVTKGDTSRIEYVFIQNSSVTTGAGLTGLVFNSAGLVAYYARTQGAATAITLVTQTATGAFSSGGFVEVDATNMPGVYRVDLPDACFATGVDKCVVMLKGATNMAPVTLEYQLIDANLEDAVRLGLTALPNVASGSAGALPTTGTGANQLSVASGLVTLAGVTHTGAVIPTVTTLTNLPAITANWLTAAGIAADAITDAKVAADVTIASVTGAVGSVTAAVTVGTNNDKTGYGLSAAAIQAIWDALTSALTAVGSIGLLIVNNLNAAITSRLATYTQPTGFLAATFPTTVASPTNITSATGIAVATGGIGSGAHAAAELNAIADATLDRNMATGTDSGTDSTAVRTPRQALRVLRNRNVIAAGVQTVNKENDTTVSHTAAVVTTAGNPISSVDPT